MKTPPDIGRAADPGIATEEPREIEPLDVEAIKAQFPALQQTVHGKPRLPRQRRLVSEAVSA